MKVFISSMISGMEEFREAAVLAEVYRQNVENLHIRDR